MTKAIVLDMCFNYPKDQRLKYGMVFSGSLFNGDYDYIDSNYTVQGYSEEQLEIYVNWLRKQKQEKGDKMESNFLIFDDVVGILDSNTSFFSNFITTFRHTKTTIFICVQYLKRNISTTVRGCINHAILFNEKTERSRRAYWEDFGQAFPKFEDFVAHFEKVTGDSDLHTAMLCVENVESREDNYLPLRAPAKLPNVEICWGSKNKQKT